MDTGLNLLNKKRAGDVDPTEDEIAFALQTKRSTLESASGQNYFSPEATLLFKVLCPSQSIGSIIGKSGSVITEINQKTGAKVRVSQAEEFFPETNDRIILISGTKAAIAAAVEQVITRTLEVT